PEVGAAVAGKRGSVPTVSSSVPHALPDRRASEPALLQAEVMSRQDCSRSGQVDRVSNPQHNTGHLAADIAEDQSQDTSSTLWAQSSELAQACDGQNQQETSSNETEDSGAAAAASNGQGSIKEAERLLQSKNVTCGICMEKVYEKDDSRNQVFGILPNCNHSFCLQCIMTWRKTKDLGLDVVKTCPQCRVRSAFYVPNKFWVEGQAKESLIAAFKEKFSKKSCSYYSRYRCCPFKTECLYRHDKHARRRSFQYPTEDEDEYDGVDLLNLFIAMTLLGGDDEDDYNDDYDFPFYLSEEYKYTSLKLAGNGQRRQQVCGSLRVSAGLLARRRMSCSPGLRRFDGQSKLLLRSLLSGALRAAGVFHRQQRANPDMSLSAFIETLCRDEVCPNSGTQPLTVKPLVCLFPTLFKQNLLSFIYLVCSALPRTTILHLLKCLGQDPHLSPWVVTMMRQLERNLGARSEEPLYTPPCSRRLDELLQRLVGFGETGGWAKCLSGQTVQLESQSASGSSELGMQRKRKGSFVTLDSDGGEDTGRQSKRMKMDVCGSESLDAEEQCAKEEISGRLEEDPRAGSPAEKLQPAADSLCDALPEHIKVSVLHIKELLESQTEWDESSTDVFKVLNNCDPGQVEVLCSMLSLPDLPEQALPKVCSGILAPSLDLSYSTAAALIRCLLLKKVLSLSEPASRSLLTTATSLCSRCPRPMCHALIGPVLEDENIGNPQAELLNRLIEGCLDSHYRLLVLQMTLKLAWSEAMLSIIHSLLDSKLDLSEEVFTQFTEELVNQGPQFTKSVKFAKMMLTVLTKYSSHVSRDTLYEAVKEVLQGSQTKPRKFVETVELQISLKNYDPQKDKRFSGTVRLKTLPRPKFSVCVLGDQQHCDEAKAADLPHMDIEALKKLNKNKKLVKKLAKKYDAFLASESLIKQIPRILGPGLNKAGKFPSLLTHNENMNTKVDEVKSTIKFQMKKVLCLAVAVGHVKMTEDELVYNIHLAVNFLVSLLKKNWQNVRALYVKSTMGKPQRLY
ncbi:hypothetical protein L3Q82_015827, partial [Scortum barcoo]